MLWIGVGRSKFEDWRQRFGKVNEHNAWVQQNVEEVCGFEFERRILVVSGGV